MKPFWTRFRSCIRLPALLWLIAIFGLHFLDVLVRWTDSSEFDGGVVETWRAVGWRRGGLVWECSDREILPVEFHKFEVLEMLPFYGGYIGGSRLFVPGWIIFGTVGVLWCMRRIWQRRMVPAIHSRAADRFD